MLRLLFWILFLVNAALFSYQQGWLASVFPDGREPQRVAKQVNPTALKVAAVVPEAPPAAEASASAAASASSSASASAVAEAKPESKLDSKPEAKADAKAPAVAACSEIGNFDKDEATRFEQRLNPLALGNKLVKRTLQEAARNMVYMPPQGSKEGADKKAGELRRLGVNDFFIIQEGEYRWGISLGVFKSEEAARAHLADLSRRGVNTARLGLFNVSTVRSAYQFKGLDEKANAAVLKIKADFAKQEVRACEG